MTRAKLQKCVEPVPGGGGGGGAEIELGFILMSLMEDKFSL